MYMYIYNIYITSLKMSTSCISIATHKEYINNETPSVHIYTFLYSVKDVNKVGYA